MRLFPGSPRGSLLDSGWGTCPSQNQLLWWKECDPFITLDHSCVLRPWIWRMGRQLNHSESRLGNGWSFKKLLWEVGRMDASGKKKKTKIFTTTAYKIYQPTIYNSKHSDQWTIFSSWIIFSNSGLYQKHIIQPNYFLKYMELLVLCFIIC